MYPFHCCFISLHSMDQIPNISSHIQESLHFMETEFDIYFMAPHSQLAIVSSLSQLRNHIQTFHTRQNSSDRSLSPTQRPLPENPQESPDIYALSRNPTRNSSKTAAAETPYTARPLGSAPDLSVPQSYEPFPNSFSESYQPFRFTRITCFEICLCFHVDLTSIRWETRWSLCFRFQHQNFVFLPCVPNTSIIASLHFHIRYNSKGC